MATIINNPDTAPRETNNSGIVLAIVLAVIIVFALLAYGLPGLRRSGTSTNTAPTTNTGNTSGGNGVSGQGSVNGQGSVQYNP